MLRTIIFSILLFYLLFDTYWILHKPSFIFDKSYYTSVLEAETENDAVIVTDPVISLSATGKRKVYSVAVLIYYWFRIFYDYRELVRNLSPNYIILTERMKQWGEARDRFNQREEFQRLLRDDFVLKGIIKNKRYGDLWIYKMERKK